MSILLLFIGFIFGLTIYHIWIGVRAAQFKARVIKSAESIPRPTPGSFLRDSRNLRGVKQKDLAKHLGITQVKLSNIENGKVKKVDKALFDKAMAYLKGVDK